MNDLDTPTSERAYKRHAALKAQAAVLGFELIKSDPEICGQAPYYLYRHHAARPFEDLEAAHQFLLLKVTENDCKLQKSFHRIASSHHA